MKTIQATPMADEASRKEVLLSLFKRFEHIDVLNMEAVDAYVEATGAPVQQMMYGADKCVQMGRDLSRLHDDGLLKRHAAGLTGMSGMGFPRWVYSYRLANRSA